MLCAVDRRPCTRGDRLMSERHELTWTPELVEAFWDFESQFPERYFTYSKGAEIVRQLEPSIRGARAVLDFACGAGDLTKHLLGRGFSVTGADTSPKSLAVYNERFAGQDGFRGGFDPEHLIRGDRRFDTIFVVELIEHLYDDWIDGVFEQIGRLAAPGALVVLTTPNEEPLERSKLMCPHCGSVFHRWQHVRSWSRESLADLLRNKGFEVKRAYITDFRLSYERRPDRFRTFVKRLKYRFRLRSHGPHLVAIARAPLYD
jgi:2-polyprenyl-3-methyl-5-hydroxy-6-metoxy-1,4-benzoquinol methylase